MSDKSASFFIRSVKRLAIVSLIVVTALMAVGFYLDLHLYMQPIRERFEDVVQQQVDAAKYPGAAVLVFKDNKIVFERGYGFANIEQQRKATPDTMFQIASVSKLVTATAVMKLVEQGRITLDDDINTYLPFSVRNPDFPDNVITFRHLLAHNSSINDGPAYWDSYTIGESEDPSETLEAFLTAFFTPGSAYFDDDNFVDTAPGAQPVYSNTGFGLLGYLVERVAEQPFDEFCREQIFQPLDMRSTHWFMRDVDRENMAMPYGYEAFAKTYTPVGFYGFSNYPDGLLKTSVRDFMRFLVVFTNKGKTMTGEPFLSSETVMEMLRVQYPAVGGFTGLGWHKSGNIYEHGGTDPGVGAMTVISPDEQWGVILFANSGGLDAWRTELGHEIRQEVYEFIEQRGYPLATR